MQSQRHQDMCGCCRRDFLAAMGASAGALAFSSLWASGGAGRFSGVALLVVRRHVDYGRMTSMSCPARG